MDLYKYGFVVKNYPLSTTDFCQEYLIHSAWGGKEQDAPFVGLAVRPCYNPDSESVIRIRGEDHLRTFYLRFRILDVFKDPLPSPETLVGRNITALFKRDDQGFLTFEGLLL